MPINITDGSVTADVDGSINRALGSFTASFKNTKSYPLLATGRFGGMNYGQDDAYSAADRAAIGSMDASLLFGFGGADFMDTTPPATNWLSRTAANIEILAGNATSSHYISTYFNMMETADNGSIQANYLDSVTGPNGWDGWTYNSAHVKVVTFGSSIGANISNYVSVDGNGQRYPEWYADNIIQLEYINPHVVAGVGVGINGINTHLDNFQLHANTSNIDWDNAVGANDDAQDYYDSEDAAHVSADPIAVIAYSGFRENYMKGKKRIESNNPGIYCFPNTNQWAEEYTGAVSGLRDVILEYRLSGDTTQADVEGGLSQNNSFNNPAAFPRSAVTATGVTHPRGTSIGSWQRCYNDIYKGVDAAQEPNIVFSQWHVSCLQPFNLGAAGEPVWPNVPSSSASWNMARWVMVTSWLAGAHCAIEGIQVGATTAGRNRSTPIFDEFGLINNNVTNLLNSSWMGAPVDGPQTAARTGTLWWREFANALIILNSENDDTVGAATVPFASLPGDNTTWKRLDGFQDPTWNDGSNITADFTIPPIDAIVLERR